MSEVKTDTQTTDAKKAGVGNVTIAVLTDIETKRANAEWPFDVGLVRLDRLIIDDSYQRPPHDYFIKDIASNFDETLVGTIDVSERKGTYFSVLDGQQRYHAMNLVGKTACYCSVYRNMSLADEAAFFYRKNRDRRTMKPYYAFRARVVANDPEAMQIQNLVEAQGFTLAPASNERDVIGAIVSIQRLYEMPTNNEREECISPALKTIRQSFYGRKESISSSILLGFGEFFREFSDEDLDFPVLWRVLEEMGPNVLLESARAIYIPVSGRQGFSGERMSKGLSVARIMAGAYNKAINPQRGGSPTSGGRLDMRRLS